MGEAIESAKSARMTSGCIGFLSNMKEPPLRNRSELEPACRKIELVSPEEIRLAILKEVRHAFSIPIEDVAQNAARIFGFQRVTAQTKKHFDTEVSFLIKEKLLVSRNGSISLA